MSDDISIPPPSYDYSRHRMSESPSGTFSTGRIALMILAAVGVGAVGASVIHYRGGPVPVIEADNRPIRVKPENPGGMQIAGANNDLLSGGNDTADSRLAPPPETPNPQALHADAPPPAAVASPVPTPAPAPAAVAPPAPKPKPPVVATAAPVATPAHPVVHGKATIQLAALETEAAARAEWQSLAKRFPELLAGHEPVFSKIEHAGKTYWRLRTAGFTDVERAKAACEKIRAKGSTCSVADF